MRHNLYFVVILGLSVIFSSGQNVDAQSPDTDGKKLEVGAQFSILQASLPSQVRFTGIQCVTTPCPSTVISNAREIQPGFGGRIGYNVTNNFAIEAEINFFPGAGSLSVPEPFTGGHKIQGLFGAKAGKRFDKVGIFGKGRPGFLYASKGDLQPRSNTGCPTIFPPPAGCSETTSKTNLAFDVGGVVELYPTKRTVIRIDAGDTIVRLNERTVSAVINVQGIPVPTFVTVVRAPAETTHNFQGSIGIGFRF